LIGVDCDTFFMNIDSFTKSNPILEKILDMQEK